MTNTLIHLSIIGFITILFIYNLKDNEIEKIFEKSKNIKNARLNETEFYLNRGKIKGTINSYIEPIYPNDKEGFLIERDYENNIKLENATILVLCRNFELEGILKSMRSLEDKFNKNYHYPWTFLNDVPFDEDFILWTTEMASGKTEYGLIPSEDWDTPDFINQEEYNKSIEKSIEDNVIYGFSKSYRNMCHFNSGYFFRQELVNQYDYYFRVEPDVEYFCDFQYDPFKFLRVNNKKYSFIVSIYEYENTIPTLWENVENFLKEFPQHLHPNNSLEFLINKEQIGVNPSSETNSSYNLCHFWSNFEIGDLNFFRSQEYLDYFNYLDKTGGFYYERWGDAPVHSIAASILLDKNQLHYFDDIGYTHVPFYTFPKARQVRKYKRCVVPKDVENISTIPSSCIPKWWKFGGGKTFLKDNFDPEQLLKYKEHANIF